MLSAIRQQITKSLSGYQIYSQKHNFLLEILNYAIPYCCAKTLWNYDFMDAGEFHNLKHYTEYISNYMRWMVKGQGKWGEVRENINS